VTIVGDHPAAGRSGVVVELLTSPFGRVASLSEILPPTVSGAMSTLEAADRGGFGALARRGAA
jgi:hypothetical protein